MLAALCTLLLGAMLLPSSATAKGRLLVVYDYPEPEDIQAARSIRQSEVAEEVAEIVADWNLLDTDVTVRFGTQIGPHFTVLNNGAPEIQIPYSFYSATRDLFAARSFVDQVSPEISALNTLHHALYHELGHAVIYTKQTGISEQIEEQAVDELATIMLISAYDEGATIAASAAKAFQLLSTEPDTVDARNDIRRVQAISCLIYGSDPKKNADLLEDLPTNSDSLCPARFISYHKQWEKIFNIPLPD